MSIPLTVGERVTFPAKGGALSTGTVFRIWERPAADPYVTIKTEDAVPQTYVRLRSQIQHA